MIRTYALASSLKLVMQVLFVPIRPRAGTGILVVFEPPCSPLSRRSKILSSSWMEKNGKFQSCNKYEIKRREKTRKNSYLLILIFFLLCRLFICRATSIAGGGVSCRCFLRYGLLLLLSFQNNLSKFLLFDWFRIGFSFGHSVTINSFQHTYKYWGKWGV